MTENTLTVWALTQSLLADLEADKASILSDRYPEDEIHSYVDSRIPVYHHQLAQLLADKPSLGEGPDDSGLIGDKPTVWSILTAAVYELLSEAAFEWLSEAQEEAEEAKEAEEEEEEEEEAV